MKTEDVMTRRVVACRADTDLAHVARLMWENDCGAVPVVDAEDRVVGILTDRDLSMTAHFQGRALRELKAEACMAREVATSRPDAPVAELIELMAERRVRRIPITDEGGRLLGLVSLGDLFGAAEHAGDKKRKLLHAALIDALARISAHPVREDIAPALPAKKTAKPADAPRPSSKKRSSKA